MSAFGIGTNTQCTNAGEIRGTQKEVACDCWFTSNGKTMPRLIKFIDENDVLQTVTEIMIEYTERKNYSGIPSVEYTCTITCEGRLIKVKLIRFQIEDKWVMTYL